MVSAVLVLQGWWIAGGIAFIVGSVCDTLDGRYSRMSGKGSPFGAFLDSTLDRLEEGIVLAAVGYRLVKDPDLAVIAGTDVAVAIVVLAVLASLMVSYTRARAEALGVECKVGIADRAVRVVVLSAGLVFGDLKAIEPAVYVLAAMAIITVFQRIFHVRSELREACNRNPLGGLLTDGHHVFPKGTALDVIERPRPLPERKGPGRHHRRRQLRERVRAGRALLQGRRSRRSACPGLMHVDLGGYHVRDIEFSAAFDIDADKVGKDLSEAIWAGQNNTIKFVKEDVPHLGMPVQRGMTHDGLGKYLSEKITKAPGLDRRHRRGAQGDQDRRRRRPISRSAPSRRPSGTSSRSSRPAARLVNCIPVFIAREQYWNNRFKKAGLPIVGDDIKSQVGATIVHRALARLFGDRGVELQRTSQLNVGGNMDFYNMLERERLESKKISKTNAVTSIVDHEMPAKDVHVGPSDYVPWLEDRKWAHIRLEGAAFGDVPLTAELKLEVWDSPNSAGIVIDAARCCKLALNHGVGGQLDGPSSYLMKSPMNQRPDDEARAGDRGVHRPPRAHREGRPRGAREGRRRSRRPRRSSPSNAPGGCRQAPPDKLARSG